MAMRATEASAERRFELPRMRKMTTATTQAPMNSINRWFSHESGHVTHKAPTFTRSASHKPHRGLLKGCTTPQQERWLEQAVTNAGMDFAR